MFIENIRVKMNHFLWIFGSLTLTLAVSPFEEPDTSNRFFSEDVYQELLLDNNENFLVSPFSAEVVVALSSSGARGATAEEIRAALYLPCTKEETEEHFQNVLSTMKSDYVTVTTANKVYVGNNFSVKDGFKAVATEVYQADFQNVDFSHNEETANEINKWVEEHTNEKIKDLINSDALSADTKIILVNALYFQGNWSTPFSPYRTSNATFHTSEESAVNASLMSMYSEEFNYAESDELDAQILELPFIGKKAAMTFVLPNKKEGISYLEQQLSGVFRKPQFSKEFVQVSIPKFKIESSIDFRKLLQQLGVTKAFDSGQADFSNIGGEPGDLFITAIKQKTFIDVNEDGVEAAAATDIEGGESEPPIPTKFFVADHPFIFYLTVNDIVLFEGRILEPQY